MMEFPHNAFKDALASDACLIGLWLGLADPYSAEMLATTGFDWLLIDGEHAPNDVRKVLAQLQAIAPYPSHPIVRPVSADPALIKQYLDIGVQTLLVPMIDNAEQAASIVGSALYPPRGTRGVGASLARSSRWNTVPNYLHRAHEELCLLLQVESADGMQNLDAIAKVEGVDGVFFGPADLSASLGWLGNPNHPEVRAMIEEGVRHVRALGKAAGVLTSDLAVAKQYMAAGANFVGVGVDTTLLVRSAMTLRAQFPDDRTTETQVAANSGY